MKQEEIKTENLHYIYRKNYYKPQIEIIILDNEISLILSSQDPPTGPGESYYQRDIQNPMKDETCLV